MGNTFRRLAAKCDGDAATARKESYGTKQLGYNTPRGAEVAVHSTRAFINSDQITERHVLIKVDFENAFNSVSRQAMLDKILAKYPSLYKFTSSCYGQSSHLFFGDSLLSSQVGPQQGDPEAPPLFCDVTIDMINGLNSSLNIWYLDDGAIADTWEVALEDLKKIKEVAAELGLKIKPSKCEITFLGQITSRMRDRILSEFNSVCPGIIVTPKEELELLGAPLGAVSRKRVLDKKVEDFETMSSNLEKMEPHTALFLLRNCFSIPKILYFLRTSECFRENTLLDKYDTLINRMLERITNVSMDKNSLSQARLPDNLGGLGIPSAVDLAPSAFLASVCGSERLACAILGTDCLIDRHVVLNNVEALETTEAHAHSDAFRSWSEQSGLRCFPDVPSVQKSWTRPVHNAILQSLRDSLSANEQARLASVQGRTAAAFLKAFPSVNLGLKMSPVHLRITVALRLGCKVCEIHECVCGKTVSFDGRHGLSCKYSSGRHARHSALNEIVKKAFNSANIPAVREPPGLCRRDGKRPDGLTLVPWAQGKCLVWDVTAVDALAPSRVESFEPLKAAEEAEGRKEAKYQELITSGYTFQPIAFETQGNCGPRTLRFLNELGSRLRASTMEDNARQYLFQRISIAIHTANAACVLGTMRSSEKKLDEVFFL